MTEIFKSLADLDAHELPGILDRYQTIHAHPETSKVCA